MKDITLRQLEYFRAILDRGSLGAAAQACNVSQATVSAALGQLEKQLDVTLIARGPARRARPTIAGREFGAHAEAILAAVSDAVASIDDESPALRGPLVLGCIPSAAPRMLPATASTFVRSFPGVQLNMVEDNPTALQQMVLAGEVDVAVLYRKQVQLEGLRRHPLAEVRLHALVPGDHHLADRDDIDIAELLEDPLILLSAPPTAELLVSQIRSLGHEPVVRWLIPSAETIRSMVGWGLGCSLANAVPHPDNRSFQGMPVRYLPVSNPEFANTIVGVTMGAGRITRKIDTALSTLRTVAADTDPARWSDGRSA